MAWVYLFIAGGLEVFWSTFLKLSEGFTKLWPSVWAVAGMIASFFFLSQATKTLPMGTAYGIWTGIGALGAVIVGILAFQEPVTVQVVENALYAGASSIILAHNHPSGVALPSRADVQATVQVRDALKRLDIRLIDHIIVADGDYVSMASSGLLR